MTKVPAEGARDAAPKSESEAVTVSADPHLKSGTPLGLGVLGEELRDEKPISPAMMIDAIGGWRGILDSGLPSLIFVFVFLFNGHVLPVAIWAAVISGVLIAALRLFRRQSIQQVISGFFGIALSAFIASKTGQAEDFFLPGILLSGAFGFVYLLSILVKWPLVGVVVGSAIGDPTGWRKDAELTRAYRAATWIWVGMYVIKLSIQLPLYFLGMVGALGFTKIALGYPMIALACWFSYLLIRKPLHAHRMRLRAAEAGAKADTDAGADAGDDVLAGTEAATESQAATESKAGPQDAS